jgi:hypothetical protein
MGALLLLLALGLAAWQGQAASAQQSSNNIGGGTAEGTLEYTNPGGLPQAFAPCKPVTFDLLTDSQANIVVNVKTEGGTQAFDGFAGVVQLQGSGRGGCEGVSMGGGSLNVVIPEATAPNGAKFKCPDLNNGVEEGLNGGYTRVGADLEAILGGYCYVNLNRAYVTFVYRGVFRPLGGEGLDQPGLSRPVTQAEFKATFLIMPA